MPNPNIAEAGRRTRFTSETAPRNGGRPKKLPITERYAEILEEELPENIRVAMKLKKGATWGDAAVLSTMRDAVKTGDVGTLKEIADRVEGKARQRIEMQLSGSVDLFEIISEARKRVTSDEEETPKKKRSD